MRLTRFALLLVVTLALVAPGVTAPAIADPFPETIPLPAGFQPEGISKGRGASFYVGSLADGTIYRGDLRTGEGSVLVEGDGDPAVGTEVDRRNRLWVAGGPSGSATVYDAATGEPIREYTFGGAGFINDVVVTRRAAYFTDSFSDRLYVVPIGPGGRLGDAETLALSGDFVLVADDFNANGIEASPNGRTLLVVHSTLGVLYSVDAATGAATEVDLDGQSLTSGDGLLRQGRTLYVVRNFLDQIAVVELGAQYQEGTVVRTLTDDDFRIPTTVARWGSRLYAVNARFDTEPTPTTDYDVVRVDRR
jgi:sugar lactone lactonase YvrE